MRTCVHVRICVCGVAVGRGCRPVTRELESQCWPVVRDADKSPVPVTRDPLSEFAGQY